MIGTRWLVIMWQVAFQRVILTPRGCVKRVVLVLHIFEKFENYFDFSRYFSCLCFNYSFFLIFINI
jgi:hypothetical protein